MKLEDYQAYLDLIYFNFLKINWIYNFNCVLVKATIFDTH